MRVIYHLGALALSLLLVGCADVWGFPDLSTSQGGPGDAGAEGGAGAERDAGADGGVCVRASPGTCGLAPQCGCGSSQTCVVADTAGTASCVDAGNSALGQACNTTSDCAPGLTCTGGACRPYCSTVNTPCTAPGTGQCGQLVTPGGTNVPNGTVCTVNCQLDDQSACGGIPANGPIAACIPVSGASGLATDCRAAGRSTTTCGGGTSGVETPPLCAPGYECESLNATFTCAPWCRVGVAGVCPASQNCNPFSQPLVISGTPWGTCY
jgi:hypothetical protein